MQKRIKTEAFAAQINLERARKSIVYLYCSKERDTFGKERLNNYDLSLVMRKPVFCICENKDADQLRGNREAGQRLCFQYTDSTIPVLLSPKFQASSYLLWLYSPVCVGPGRKPRRPVFSQRVLSRQLSRYVTVKINNSFSRNINLCTCTIKCHLYNKTDSFDFSLF